MIIHYPLPRKAPRLEASFSDPWGGFRKASNSALTSEEREFLLAGMIGGDGADGDLCIIHNSIYIYTYVCIYSMYIFSYVLIMCLNIYVYIQIYIYLFILFYTNCLCVFLFILYTFS